MTMDGFCRVLSIDVRSFSPSSCLSLVKFLGKRKMYTDVGPERLIIHSDSN